MRQENSLVSTVLSVYSRLNHIRLLRAFFLLENVDFADITKGQCGEIRNTHINIGTGKDVCIKELAELIKRVARLYRRVVF